MSWSKGVLLVVGLSVTASSAVADPLVYTLQSNSIARLLLATDVEVTFTPPLGEPITQTLLGTSDLTSRPTDTAVADVGLPNFFQGGARGLYLSAFDAHTDFNGVHTLLTNLFDGIVPLLPVPPPIPLAGAALFVDYADLDVNLMGPLQSPFFSVDPRDPNVYYWGGVAPFQVSGSVNLLIRPPGQEPIQLATVPFGPLTVDAAAGSFTGDATTTRLVVGLEDVTLDPDMTSLIQPYVIDLAPLGVISMTIQRMRVVANGSFQGLNSQYGLPWPKRLTGSASACGIGPELAGLLPVLAWLRCRRQRRA